MRSQYLMSFGLFVVLASSSEGWAEGEATGQISPQITARGATRDNCALLATPNLKEMKGSKTWTGIGSVAVPPGAYRVRVECEGEPKLVGVVESVKVKAGQAITPKLSLEPARIRVRAERNGNMITAEVQLRRPKAEEEEPPLYSFPANQSVEVAAGRYDLIVAGHAEDKSLIEAGLEGASLIKGKLGAFTADLSDGQLIATAKENGKAAEAIIKVMRRGDVKRDLRIDAGKVIDLPPGRYIVETTLASTANFATKRQTVWVKSKKKTSVSESFETGRLSVEAEGDKIEAVARIGLPGAADDFSYFRVPDVIVLSPGEYRVRVEAKIDGPVKIQEAKLTIHKGRETKHRAKFHPAKLIVEVKRAGRRVEIQNISVHAAGGGKDVGQPNFDGEYVLWPGRYEILAKLTTGDEVADGPFEVSWGERLVRTLEVAHGTLTVSAKRGGAVVKAAKIQVFKPGAAKATVELQGEGTVPLSPGTYDLKIIDGPNTKWQPGVRVHERKNTEVEVELEPQVAPSADPELPPGDDLPEGE